MSSVALLQAFTVSVPQPFLELDSLWHYQCIISPRSSSKSNGFSPPPSPVSSPGSPPTPSTTTHHAFLPPTDPICSQQSPDCLTLDPFLQHADPSSTSSRINASILHKTGGLIVDSVVDAAPLQVPALAPNSPTSLCTGRGISHSERRMLQRVFHTLDENHDGRVSKEELVRLFEKLGISKTERDITSLLKSTHLKVEGQLDEDEFVLLYEAASNLDEQLDEEANGVDVDRDLREAFRAFDKDDNGFITPDELQSVLCSLGFPQAQELEACIKMIERVDENGDGQVDFFEFKKMLGVEEQIAVSSDAIRASLVLQTPETT